MVKINGNMQDMYGMPLVRYLSDAGYDTARIAVEINGRIIPKNAYAETLLCDGDTVEVVSFVGGG